MQMKRVLIGIILLNILMFFACKTIEWRYSQLCIRCFKAASDIPIVSYWKKNRYFCNYYGMEYDNLVSDSSIYCIDQMLSSQADDWIEYDSTGLQKLKSIGITYQTCGKLNLDSLFRHMTEEFILPKNLRFTHSVRKMIHKYMINEMVHQLYSIRGCNMCFDMIYIAYSNNPELDHITFIPAVYACDTYPDLYYKIGGLKVEDELHEIEDIPIETLQPKLKVKSFLRRFMSTDTLLSEREANVYY